MGHWGNNVVTAAALGVALIACGACSSTSSIARCVDPGRCIRRRIVARIGACRHEPAAFDNGSGEMFSGERAEDVLLCRSDRIDSAG